MLLICNYKCQIIELNFFLNNGMCSNHNVCLMLPNLTKCLFFLSCTHGACQ